MAKETRRKLSDAAIAFIIKERENPLIAYTFEQIAKLVETEFKVSISRNAVSKSYHKHKDDDAFKKLQVGEQHSKENLKNQQKDKSISDVPKKPKIEVEIEPVKPSKKIRDFDENAGKGISIDHLF
ncbi:hypothetical protein [Psychrobacter sp. TWP2-1-2]|uniref:hypothetical protein n=1 Tax=Psychrobacter sp. TWP2-1-2 TaxID=2804623 RepID=UPI003CFB57C2